MLPFSTSQRLVATARNGRLTGGRPLQISQQSSTNYAVVDTAVRKIGTGSVRITETVGDEAGLIITNSDNVLTLLESDFTVEFWYWVDSVDVQGRSVVSNRSQFLILVSGGNSPRMRLYNASFTAQFTLSGTAQSINTWNHVAATRNGNTWRLFQNGTLVDDYTPPAGDVWAIGSNNWYIGDLFGSGNNDDFNMDEFRISNIARYTSNFTPQTTPFINDANTLCLIHFDGTSGQTTFTDDAS